MVYIDIFAKLRSILVIRHSLAGLESGMIQIKRTRPLKRKQTQKEKKKLTRIEMNESYEFINNQKYYLQTVTETATEQNQNATEDTLFEE